MIGFDRAKKEDEHFHRMVHFFLYDYEFEEIWKSPDKYIERMKKYRAMLTPDFSMYIEMHPIMQLYNTFRNRWVGAYFAHKGVKVIPTVSWGLENTFDFCFNGIEKGSAVAVSTYMVSEHNNHSDQKEFFLKGYNEMLRRIEPEKIICYNEPFSEMQGDIVFVDYDLSSWRHMHDIKEYTPSPYAKYICGAEPWPRDCSITIKTGYVIKDNDFIKGMGSAQGGSWQPSPNKPDDQRFIGEPGTVNITTAQTKNGTYERQTKIGEDGRAIRERHETDHGRSDKHTNPHDHNIDWSDGFPNPGPPINYPGDSPAFKNYERIRKMNSNITNNNFENINDFKWCVQRGGEIEFCVGERIFGVFSKLKKTPESPFQILVCEKYIENQESHDLWCDSADEALEYKIDGVRLHDIITTVEVTDRTI